MSKKASRHRGIKALSREGQREETHMDGQDKQDENLNKKASRDRGIKALSGERQEENREWTRLLVRHGRLPSVAVRGTRHQGIEERRREEKTAADYTDYLRGFIKESRPEFPPPWVRWRGEVYMGYG